MITVAAQNIILEKSFCQAPQKSMIKQTCFRRRSQKKTETVNKPEYFEPYTWLDRPCDANPEENAEGNLEGELGPSWDGNPEENGEANLGGGLDTSWDEIPERNLGGGIDPSWDEIPEENPGGGLIPSWDGNPEENPGGGTLAAAENPGGADILDHDASKKQILHKQKA